LIHRDKKDRLLANRNERQEPDMSRPYCFLLIALMIVGAAGCGSAAKTQAAFEDEPDTLPDETSAKSKKIPES